MSEAVCEGQSEYDLERIQVARQEETEHCGRGRKCREVTEEWQRRYKMHGLE